MADSPCFTGLSTTCALVLVRDLQWPRPVRETLTSRGLSGADVAVGRLSFVDAPILTLRNELHGDRLGWSTALVHELVHVGSSIDERHADRVRDAAAMPLITRIIGHRASDDEDQARSCMRVPPGRRARRESVSTT